MTSLAYDGSFEGFLTAVFEVYEYKFQDPLICVRPRPQLFAPVHLVHTSPAKADRVLKKLRNSLSAPLCRKIYEAHLSEEDGLASLLLRFIRSGLKSGPDACNDFSNETVLRVHQAVKKVHRERHRMEAFVRFKQSADGLYFAEVAPDFDVLPLISQHFKMRYADQSWLIYDVKRAYGIMYDLHEVRIVEKAATTRHGEAPGIPLHEDEIKFQDLWRRYFNSVNIAERKNMALHVRHMPVRYWPFLTEKQM